MDDMRPMIRFDGREIFLASSRSAPPRAGSLDFRSQHRFDPGHRQ